MRGNSLSRLMAMSLLGITPSYNVHEVRLSADLTREAKTFCTPSGPRHTPKLSGRPERGWRSVQRRSRFAKLSRRVRANGRAA